MGNKPSLWEKIREHVEEKYRLSVMFVKGQSITHWSEKCRSDEFLWISALNVSCKLSG